MYGEASQLEGYLEYGGEPDKVLAQLSVQCYADANKPSKVGTDRGSQLCGRPANLEHILSSCRASLTEGEFRWSHDQVLAQLAG